MIDPLTEQLITPQAARQLYPRDENGALVHISRIYKDMKSGRGGILLEALRTPRLATTSQAVARFFRRMTEAAAARAGTPPVRSQSARERANARVDRELDRIKI